MSTKEQGSWPTASVWLVITVASYATTLPVTRLFPSKQEGGHLRSAARVLGGEKFHRRHDTALDVGHAGGRSLHGGDDVS